jgi:hypothetical protein
MCFFGIHKWSKWTVSKTYKIFTVKRIMGVTLEPRREVGTGEIQRRECGRCGQSEYRDVSQTILD